MGPAPQQEDLCWFHPCSHIERRSLENVKAYFDEYEHGPLGNNWSLSKPSLRNCYGSALRHGPFATIVGEIMKRLGLSTRLKDNETGIGMPAQVSPIGDERVEL